MGFFSKLFGKKEKNEEVVESNVNLVSSKSFPVYINPNIYLAHRGARICIGKDAMNGDLNDKTKYVSKIISYGHESVVEHTNVIGLIILKKNEIKDKVFEIIDILNNGRYLHYSVKENEDSIVILVGGSIRAFYHVIRESNQDYKTLNLIKNLLYQSVEKELLKPLIKERLLEDDKCNYYCDGELDTVKSLVTQVKNSKEDKNVENYDINCKYTYEPEELDKERCTLIYKTDIDKVLKEVKKYGFTRKDIYKVATVSFVFHNISRACANQLVRHRVGISQESQRYVTHDYLKNNDFIDNVVINREERYSDEKFNGVFKKLDTINPFRTYQFLISNKIMKEDARAYLPMNVITQLMMTFTYEQYAHLLQLRLDKAAQREIRETVAESATFLFDTTEMRDKFISLCTNYGYHDYDYKDPLLEEFDNINIDEEETVEESEDLKINNEEDAKKILDLSEKYKKLGNE